MTKQPNIVFITCHDLGRWLHCYGIDTVQTPAIDGLAADGVQFDNVFCTAPQCSPARASMATGRYPESNGVMGLAHMDFAWDLHPDEVHIGQALRDAGYHNALIGIAHEGIHHTSRGYTAAQVAERAGMDMYWLDEHLAHEISDQAIAVMSELASGSKPFYMQIGYVEPHRLDSTIHEEAGYQGFIGDHITPDDELGTTVPPYIVDDELAREDIAELQGAVKHVDEAIGRVLAHIEALGIRENTLVFFTADHGVALPRAKCSLTDPGLEIPLIMRLPSRGWVGGRHDDSLLSGVDFMPTLLDMLGLPISERIQGRSFLGLLDGGAYTPREAIFGGMTYHTYYDPMRCIRTDRYKLIVNFTVAPEHMGRGGSWRPRVHSVVARGHHPLIELYDLESDPNELTNLADDVRLWESVREPLLARLGQHMQATGDPLLDGPVASPTHHRAVAAVLG